MTFDVKYFGKYELWIFVKKLIWLYRKARIKSKGHKGSNFCLYFNEICTSETTTSTTSARGGRGGVLFGRNEDGWDRE